MHKGLQAVKALAAGRSILNILSCFQFALSAAEIMQETVLQGSFEQRLFFLENSEQMPATLALTEENCPDVFRGE